MLFLLNLAGSGPRVCSAATSAGALALACALALAPPPLGAQQPTTQQTYTVHGTVLDSATHQPIARALVVTAQNDGVLTDNDGRFELSLPAGGAQLSVRRPGYISPDAMTGAYAQYRVQVGANTPEITLYLAPLGLIIGHVTLSTADQADGIQVMAYSRGIVNGRRQWEMRGMAKTNGEGIFRIAGLRPGDYLLYAQPPRYLDEPFRPGAKSYGYSSAYYPGVTDISEAGILTLAAGQKAEANFALVRQPFYSVTVMMPQGIVRGVGLQVHDAGGQTVFFPEHLNPQQGVAQFNMPDGRYFIDAHSRVGDPRGSGFSGPAGMQMQSYGRVDFTVSGAPISGLNLTLLPLHAILVDVQKNFNAPPAEPNSGAILRRGAITGGGEGAGINLTLIRAAEPFNQASPWTALRPVPGADDGSSFELENVSPGLYWVEASPGTGYVSSITSGDKDLAREPLTVGPGGASAPIEITLRNDYGSIAVRAVSTGQPSAAPGANGGAALGEQQQVYVYAIPLFATSSSWIPTTSFPLYGIQSGRQFTIHQLPPGKYCVVAFDAPQEIAFHTPEDWAKYADEGQTVTVQAGGALSVEPHLIQANGAVGEP